MKVTNHIISQSAYSKFEAGIRDIDATIYIKLLQRMNISSDEFDYVRNDYSYGRKQNIIHSFFSLDYNHIGNLNILKNQVENFLEEHYDEDIEQIHLMCEAFIQLHDTRNIEIAKSIVKPLWEEISKYEQWYLNDIRIINAILFLFPVDIAIEFTKTILIRLDEYKNFQDAERLKIAFKINLSLLLIKNKNHAEAITVIENSLQYDKKKMSYSILALHFSREAICRANINKEGSKELMEKARQLSLTYDDHDYWNRIKQEFNYYT